MLTHAFWGGSNLSSKNRKFISARGSALYACHNTRHELIGQIDPRLLILRAEPEQANCGIAQEESCIEGKSPPR